MVLALIKQVKQTDLVQSVQYFDNFCGLEIRPNMCSSVEERPADNLEVAGSNPAT